MRSRWIVNTLWDCGGPVVFLATVCLLLGGVFLAASAHTLGLVMIASGITALTSLLIMGYRSFHRPELPLLVALCRRRRI